MKTNVKGELNSERKQETTGLANIGHFNNIWKFSCASFPDMFGPFVVIQGRLKSVITFVEERLSAAVSALCGFDDIHRV